MFFLIKILVEINFCITKLQQHDKTLILQFRHKNMLVLWIILLIIWIIWLVLWFYFLYFLRQPIRDIPDDNECFVSPANGKIIAIINNPTEDEVLYKKNSKVMDNFVKDLWEWCTMVSIMMTVMNAHYQKAPNKATLIDQEYYPGKKYNAIRRAYTMRATFQNEYNNMLFEQEDGIRFRVIQIAWQLARRIVPLLEVNDTVEQWDTIGLIKFWSQVTIVFDKNVDVIAKVWDIVVDGETIIAKAKNTAKE